MFGTATYVNRRAKLKETMDSGLLLFLGNSDSPMNYEDNMYHFRQDSSFLYYFGLDDPDLAAVIDLDSGEEIIFGNELSIDYIVWMGFLPTIKERAEQVGITDTRPLTALTEMMGGAKQQGRKVHFLPPYRAANKLKLMDLLDIHPHKAGELASLEFIKAVIAMRSVKSDEEVSQIEDAVNTSVDMHVAAMKLARPGMLESEISAEVEKVAMAAGGHVSFPVIATINGQTLHNHYHGNRISEGDLFLLDTGAENAMHYAGDLTSTFPVSRTFTEKQKLIYAVQQAAHKASVDTLAPGVPNRDVHFAAARATAEGMRALGMMKGNVDDALEAGAHALFFPHGIGHMMGLDVHDMEDLGENLVGYDGAERSTLFGLKSLRLAKPLQPGYVLTIEPGVYFIPQLIDLWREKGMHTDFLNYDEIEKWKDFGGIRNEEDYLITETGKQLLGKKKPMSIDEVEVLRAY